MVLHDPVHPDALELADLLRPSWAAVRERIRLSGHPTCEGEPDPDPKPDPDPDPAPAGLEPDPDPAKKDPDPDPEPVKPDDDWKSKSRKNETRAKKAERERDELAARIAEIEKSNLSEQEQAILKAREEAASEVTTKYEQERRAERLELAVTKIAVGQGITIGEGDKAKTVKFSDPDDVQMWLERKMNNGDINADDIYKDGKIDAAELTSVLAELAKSKPTWLVSSSNGDQPPRVADIDAGKGKGAGAKALEEMTPDDHLKEIQASR